MRVAPPPRQPDWKRKTRNYLTPNEIERVIQAARHLGRHGHRDSTMILLAYRHGFRASEVIHLKWDQINLNEGFLTVHRLKNGVLATHPLWGPEIRALRKLRRESPDTPYVFVSERKAPLTRRSFQHIVTRAGEAADIGFPISSHVCRHSCGFKLANDGQDIRAIAAFLGHKSLNNTMRYTTLVAGRFKGFWRD
jgi:integrase